MLVKFAFVMQKLKKYVTKFLSLSTKMGGGQFFDFMGGHRAHGGPAVPPTKEIPGVWFRKGKYPHTQLPSFSTNKKCT